MRKILLTTVVSLLVLSPFMVAKTSFGHGDVTPQAVDTTGLDPLPEEIALENPYRAMGGEQYELAKSIGSSAYNSNCARCHGLQVISGGIAPDLRLLEDGELGDEWFMERIRKGYNQNGTYKMPPFENIMNQEAMWAIRSYTEAQPRPE